MKNDVLNVFTKEHKDYGELFIYGYIGTHWKEEKDNSDQKVVQELQRLEEKFDKIHVRINSPGGSIYHGAAIVNAIQNSKAEIHTFIDGLAASMGFMIWMSSKNRHCSKSGTAMSHKPIIWASGNADNLRESADVLDKFEDSLVSIMEDALDLEEKDIRATYFGSKNKWMSRKDLNTLNLITCTEEYDSKNKVPENITNMSYSEILNYFKDQKDPGSVSLLKSLKESYLKAQNHIIQRAAALFIHKTDIEMNLDEFKNAIKDGELSLDEVTAHLKTLEKPAPPNPTPPATNSNQPDIKVVVENALTKVVKPLSDKIESMSGDLEKLKKEPGAFNSTPPIPDDKLPEGVTDGKALAELNKSLEQFATDDVRFVGV